MDTIIDILWAVMGVTGSIVWFVIALTILDSKTND